MSSLDIPSELQQVFIMGRADPVLFAEKLLGMPLHDGQKKYLRKAAQREFKIYVLVPSNRWGKSTCIAVLQIWYHFYKIGIATGKRDSWVKAEFRTANIAPHSSLVEPVFKYIDQIMTSRFPIRHLDGTLSTNNCLISWFYLSDRTLNSPPFKQFFAFNSYVEHRTLGMTGSDSLEGKPYGLLTYDEGGRSDHLKDEINGTLLARLFDWRGQLHIPSTPDQNSASLLHHYELYQKGLLGMDGVFTMEGELKDNTFFSPDQIEEQYKLYENNPMRDQVIYGKFVFGGDNIFDAESILDAEDESLNDGVRKEDGHTYVVGIDTAIGSDEMVYTVLDTTSKPYRLVRLMGCKGNSKSPQMHLNDLLDLIDSYANENYGNIKIMLETWNGESVRFYHDLPYRLQTVTKCYGSWQPDKRNTENQNKLTPKSADIKKADLILALRKLLSAREIKIPKNNEKLVQQLSIYKEKDEKMPNDRTISLALAAWMATEGSTFLTNEVTFIDWS